MKPVRQSSKARQDLIEIWKYIATDNIDAADLLWKRFEALYDKLARQPGMGRRHASSEATMRVYPLGRYLVFYITDEQGIVIQRVLHAARDYTDIFD